MADSDLCQFLPNVVRRRSVISVVEFQTTEDKDAFMQSIPEAEDKDYTPLYDAIDKLPEKLRLTVI